ncbi:MAG: hypothetical protein R8G66_23720 [Cytophagales bacterium]|nr:hypothetical protein [Cytophagales bacterium]
MKNLVYILFVGIILSSCDGFDLSDNGLDNLQDLPEYVAFNAPGLNATLPPFDETEGSSVDLIVEAPAGTLEDIVVSYSFGGDAVFGVDFNVAGASAAGGTVTVEHNINQAGTETTGGVAFTDRGNIAVELLSDAVVDGDKVLTVTLTSAARGSETIAVGRGGTDFLRVATVNIADED